MNYLSAPEIEIAVARWIGIRSHLIVPNVSWGLLNHECDLLALSKSGYAVEVEIKVSKSDLRRDGQKRHRHESNRVRYLYFAIPLRLENCVADVPARAGIILVNRNGECILKRWPKANASAHKFTPEERLQLARLGALRVWALKERLFAQSFGQCDFSI